MLCSKEIRTKNFTVYDVKYSDHLPLLLDFEIT
jgi:endonuclease/exonuclease/phosphatase family metal-dependent hydrolase